MKVRLKVSKAQLSKLVAGKTCKHSGKGNYEVIVSTDEGTARKLAKNNGVGIVGGSVVKFRNASSVFKGAIRKLRGGDIIASGASGPSSAAGLDRTSGNFLAQGRSWTGKGFLPIGAGVDGSGFVPIGGRGVKVVRYPEQF